MQPSHWVDDLLKNPDGFYKFGSIEINIDSKKNIISRQTYHLLDWLGDIGGLADALFIIFQLMLRPYMKFYTARFIVTNLFRLRDEKID